MRMTPNRCARSLGRRPGFPCGSHTPNRIDAPFNDAEIATGREVAASGRLALPLWIGPNKACSSFALPRKPKSRTPRTTRYPASRPICESHALPAGRSKRVDQHGKGPEASWATAGHKARSTAILEVAWGQSCVRSESSATAPATQAGLAANRAP